MARGSLIGLVQVVVISLVVLMRQPAAWAGLELAFVNLFYIVPVGSCQVSLFRRMSWKVPRVSLLCSSLGYLLAVAGLVGGYNL